MQPLADKIRPIKLDDVIGQEHLLSDNNVLSNIIRSKKDLNMIFYGPPGVGKTTVANIIAANTNKKLYKLNATNASTKDIKQIAESIDTFDTMNGILLYLDEIQNFNKKQQQSLLEYIEKGKITLIASTTENPYHYVYKAILSRCMVFEFKYLTKDNIKKLVLNTINKKSFINEYKKMIIDEEALDHIAVMSGGDVRKALNILELLYYCDNTNGDNINISLEFVENCINKKSLNYDKNGDSHYEILSAFQKSIRGSDKDAAVFYLAKLIKAGDLISICRRLLVIACEDIGLAYPNAITVVKSCTDAAKEVGFPEARIILAQATILLATAPKSNTAYLAIDKALDDLDKKEVGEIPSYLKNDSKDIKNYKYPHSYDNNYVKQQYLPENIKNRVYYQYGNNKIEKSAERYMNNIKNKNI